MVRDFTWLYKFYGQCGYSDDGWK